MKREALGPGMVTMPPDTKDGDLVIVQPMDPNEPAVVVKVKGEPCETFCHCCRQLRLWLRPERPTACGNCGGAIEIGPVGGERLKKLRNDRRS